MKEITKALLKAQGEFTKINKDGKNDHFGNTYASLPKVLSIVLPILRNNDILLTISTVQKEEKNYTHVRLVHVESGEILESFLPILNISDSQKMGSCITYNQRYGLLPLLGIAADIDDDGNKASNKDINSLNIELKKQELQSILDGYNYPQKWKDKAIHIMNDENSTLTVITNVITTLIKQATKNATN